RIELNITIKILKCTISWMLFRFWRNLFILFVSYMRHKSDFFLTQQTIKTDEIDFIMVLLMIRLKFNININAENVIEVE
ncbi:hypothetical protein L9F63_000142, partial [Diploptera punctata]